MRRLELFIVVAGLAASVALASDVPAKAFYKLTGRDGKVTYSDKIPKGFDGFVMRVDVDQSTNVQATPPSVPPPAAAKADTGVPDMNAKRRALREQLQAKIDQAYENLDKAKKALADGADPKEDEYQTIQQKFDGAAKAGPRTNCMKQTSVDGKTAWVCPTVVPGEKFRERQAELEAAVRAAEAELEAAQNEYRRNVS